MKKVVLFIGVFWALSFTVIGQNHELEGEWISVNLRTRGITRIRISRDELGFVIEAWGKCHPVDCVWGGARLLPLGETVDDATFRRGFAVWDPDFATKFVNVVYARNRLTVESVTIFKDGSRRSNFRMVEVMRRDGED